METIRTRAALAFALILALGAVASSWIVGHALYDVKAADRFVTVRGLSEREIPADLAFWPLVFNATGNDLASLQEEVEADAAVIERFLTELGFSAEVVSRAAPRVTDFEAQGGMTNGRDRYVIESAVVVRSPDVERVRQGIARSGGLVRQGVALIRSYEHNTQYLFTGLDTVKPEMIAEATRDARSAAEQFARDSGSCVGAIRRAQQGYFSIEDRDAFSPEIKRVRVVTTVDFFLEE